VVMGGAICAAIGWIIDAHATTLMHLYIAAVVAGIGAGCVYGTCVGTALKWFPDKRGLAAGLTAAGFGAGAAVTVVIAAGGYPEAPAKGDVITIKDLAPSTQGYLLHAGTAMQGAELVTAGGRVLNAVGCGQDLASARAAAYAVAESVEFRGAWYRRDIAERASAGS